MPDGDTPAQGAQGTENASTPPANDAASDNKTKPTTPQSSAAAKTSRENLDDSIFEAVGRPMPADANEFV